MKYSKKLLISLLTLIVLGSIVAVAISPPMGGAYLDYLETWWFYSLKTLFITSLVILILEIKRRKITIFPIITLLISMPNVYNTIVSSYYHYKYNLPPDLTPSYLSPFDYSTYLKDSIDASYFIQQEMKNDNDRSGGPKVLKTRIDTIIYSQSGQDIFIVFAKFYEKNDWGNNVDADFLISHTKENGRWKFKPPVLHYGIFCDSFEELKSEVRKVLFHQYEFSDQYKGTNKYFWDRIEFK